MAPLFQNYAIDGILDQKDDIYDAFQEKFSMVKGPEILLEELDIQIPFFEGFCQESEGPELQFKHGMAHILLELRFHWQISNQTGYRLRFIIEVVDNEYAMEYVPYVRSQGEKNAGLKNQFDLLSAIALINLYYFLKGHGEISARQLSDFFHKRALERVCKTLRVARSYHL